MTERNVWTSRGPWEHGPGRARIAAQCWRYCGWRPRCLDSLRCIVLGHLAVEASALRKRADCTVLNATLTTAARCHRLGCFRRQLLLLVVTGDGESRSTGSAKMLGSELAGGNAARWAHVLVRRCDRGAARPDERCRRPARRGRGHIGLERRSRGLRQHRARNGHCRLPRMGT